MKIVYVARHGQSSSNDDEGAITHALEQLGHTVTRIQEAEGHAARSARGDLLLFHKWQDVVILNKLKGRIPRVFWYFDLVNWADDLTLFGRNKTRIEWMQDVTPHCDLGFCTDGDWVAQGTTGKPSLDKLTHLTQGADSRNVGYGVRQGIPDIPILFTGIRQGGGKGRIAFVDEMAARYGTSFYHVQKGIHGKDLANLIASSKIVVAPISPVSDRYWSNRVYLSLGFGAFLLHPYSEGLARQYADGKEIVFYHSMKDLHDKIALYSAKDEERATIQGNGLKATVHYHTYLHRCIKLLLTIKTRLGVS